MAHMEEQILRTAKEVVIKFIEVGRISPTAFAETFSSVYQAVRQTVLSESPAPGKDLSRPTDAA